MVTSGTTTRHRVGWVIFSFFFFLANFLFYSLVTALYPPHQWTRPPLPSRAHQAPPPTTTTPTCPLITTCAMSLCPSRLHPLHRLPPRGCTHHIALPFVAAPTASLCPHHCASCTGLPPACVSFFLFLLTSSFVVQSLHSHHQPCRHSPSRAYHGATADPNDNATTTMWHHAAQQPPQPQHHTTQWHDHNTTRGVTTTATTALHGTTTATVIACAWRPQPRHNAAQRQRLQHHAGCDDSACNTMRGAMTAIATPNTQHDSSNCNTTCSATIAAATTHHAMWPHCIVVTTLCLLVLSFFCYMHVASIGNTNHVVVLFTHIHMPVMAWKPVTLNARGNMGSCRGPAPIAINFPCLWLQVWFFLGMAMGGPKIPQGHPCRTLGPVRNAYNEIYLDQIV